jgi:hypothetical protein
MNPNDFWDMLNFWANNNPTMPKQVSRAKDFTKMLANQTDDLVTGGMGKDLANENYDALTRKALIALALGGATSAGAKYLPMMAAKRAESVAKKQKMFDELMEEGWESGLFDQGFGGLNAIYDPRKAEDVWEMGNLTKRQVAKIGKEAEKSRTRFVEDLVDDLLAKEKAANSVTKQAEKIVNKEFKKIQKKGPAYK